MFLSFSTQWAFNIYNVYTCTSKVYVSLHDCWSEQCVTYLLIRSYNVQLYLYYFNCFKALPGAVQVPDSNLKCTTSSVCWQMPVVTKFKFNAHNAAVLCPSSMYIHDDDTPVLHYWTSSRQPGIITEQRQSYAITCKEVEIFSFPSPCRKPVSTTWSKRL